MDQYDTIYKIRERFSEISLSKATIVTLFVMLPIALILFIAGAALDGGGLRMELLISITLYIVPLGLIVFAFQKKNLSLIPILRDNGKHRSDLLLALPLIVFSISVVWVTILLLNYINAGIAQSYLDYLNSVDFLATSEDTPYIDYLFIFIAIAILPPLVEEIVFRGAMIERLGRKYSYKTALIFSAVLFGILHADVIGAIAVGLILSLIYLKNDSLFIPIIIHAINNGLVVLYIFLNDKFLHYDTWETTASYIEYGWIGLIFFGISGTWLLIYLRKNWNLVFEKEPITDPITGT